MPTATVWFDGACSGNPGPMGAGAVVELGGRRKELSRFFGHGTNNRAEYHGAVLGLLHALEEGADGVVLRGDSQLILRQLEGKYRVNSVDLLALWREAQGILRQFRSVRYEWVPRHANADADRLARQAIPRRA